MKPILTFFTALACTHGVYAYAEELARTPEQNAVTITPLVDEQPLPPLPNETTLPSAQTDDTAQEKVVHYTGRELVNHPQLLEELFVNALIRGDRHLLVGYGKLYQHVPEADRSLLEWAKARLLRETNLKRAITAYRSLIAAFPNNPFIRFQLAEILFQDQQFEAAQTQFEALRSVSQHPQDIAIFDRFIQAIQQKSQWNMAFGVSFLNDKNLTNSAKPGTVAHLPNGATITYRSPRQSGQGLSLWLGADKQWNRPNGRYLKFSPSLFGKYYWDNARYNELNASLGFGIGYADARLTLELMPNVQKRWYAGGISARTSRLKSYIDTYGATASGSYWLTPKLKYGLSYDYSNEKYRDRLYQHQYNGAIQSLSQTLTYLPTATHYLAFSFDLAKKTAKDRSNAYQRIGGRITLGSDLPLGFAGSTTLSLAKRHYKAPSFIGITQKNREFAAQVTLWHKAVHYAGFTPKVTYSYTQTHSNIPIYRYDKHQVFFNISKSF